MKINDIMTHRASFVGADVSLAEAARVMRMDGVTYLPVCEHQRVIGSVTDRDIVIRGLAEGYNPVETSVRSVMSAEVTVVFVDEDVRDVARLMEEKSFRRLPVLNRHERLIGVVSDGDVARGKFRLSGDTFRGELSDALPSAV
jgi:CBS domain-containing protein